MLAAQSDLMLLSQYEQLMKENSIAQMKIQSQFLSYKLQLLKTAQNPKIELRRSQFSSNGPWLGWLG